MITEIDLRPFCSVERHRSYLGHPFSLGERSYATDGHIAISAPRPGARTDVPLDALRVVLTDFISDFQPSVTRLPPRLRVIQGGRSA